MEPIPGAGGGSSLTEQNLSGLSDFNRSLNLSVLLNDKSLREAYAAAETNGELPTNRARVLILGEPRAGKTSLLNRLLGRGFDIREQPTQGIETRMCHVTNVDKQWNESSEAKADDIRECASAVALLKSNSQLTSGTPKKGTVESNNNLPKSPSTPESDQCTTSAADLMKLAAQLMFIVAVVFTFGKFQYGYVVFVWCSIGVMVLVLDYTNAYRFATSMSLACAVFEAMIRTDQPFEELACKGSAESSSEALQFTKNILFNSMNTILVGLANGLGGRTGMAVAFSASVHPGETDITLETALRGLERSWNMFMLSVIFSAGGVIGLGSYKYCTANDRWHKTRTSLCCSLMALAFASYWKGECDYRPYWYIFLNGFLMTLGGTWGAIFGRRAVLKYGFEASYVTKKIAGFLFGLYLAHVCGWSLRIPSTCLLSLAFYILSVTAHPLFDLYITYRIWRAKQAFPVKLIRGQMKAAVRGQPLLETKLSLWDFAGDTLYHCAHHVFMPDRALYVIVFNLEAAVSDEDKQLQKLLFWLHSVCAHARHPDAVIMIVGTHRASVSEARRQIFSDELHRRITPYFCHRLVLNPSNDKPLFLVENSQLLDKDFQQLRAEIFKRVESAEYAQERYPIKYLRFYREIQNRRKLAEVDCSANVMTLREVEDLATKTCDVKGEAELRNMLRFFSEAGEITYRADDEVLRQHVVLDPQFLVDVMKQLVQVPRASSRSHRYAVEWRKYEGSGIITESLLQHIYSDMSQLVPVLTGLLQAYDLMCPVSTPVNPDRSPGPKSFMVPAMLPPFRGDEDKFWESLSNEEVFYFDFGFFDPSTVYYRLLTRCLTNASVDRVNDNLQPLIFADRCRFHLGTSYVFKLQLERQSSQRILLSVTVLTFEPENPSSKLLKFLVNVVRSITARDYPHLHFTFGPRCPFCASAAETGKPNEDITSGARFNSTRGETIHVLKMAGHDRPFPTKSPAVMFCGQKRFELKLSGFKPPDIHRSSSRPPKRVAFGRETPITKLPPHLFNKVCSLLDNSPVGRNWKTLAGELGKDVESVAELDSERVANPTERLLREWAMTDGNVTVADLLEVLGRPSLERRDIVAEVCAQMTTTR